MNATRIFSYSGAQEIKLEIMTPSKIFRHVIENIENSKEYLYLITGKIGPTGKTWLCEALKKHGYNAIEITEEVYEYMIPRYNNNRYYIDPYKKLVMIVLNERLY